MANGVFVEGPGVKFTRDPDTNEVSVDVKLPTTGPRSALATAKSHLEIINKIIPVQPEDYLNLPGIDGTMDTPAVVTAAWDWAIGQSATTGVYVKPENREYIARQMPRMRTGAIVEGGNTQDCYLRNDMTQAEAAAASINVVNCGTLLWSAYHPFYMNLVDGAGDGLAHGTNDQYLPWKQCAAVSAGQDWVVCSTPADALLHPVGEMVWVRSVEHFAQWFDPLTYEQPHGLTPHYVVGSDPATGRVDLYPGLRFSSSQAWISIANNPTHPVTGDPVVDTIWGEPLEIIRNARWYGVGLVSDEFITTSAYGAAFNCELDTWMRAPHPVCLNGWHNSRVKAVAQGTNHLLELAMGCSGSDIEVTGGYTYDAASPMGSSHAMLCGENSVDCTVRVNATFKGAQSGPAGVSLCYISPASGLKPTIAGSVTDYWFSIVAILGNAQSTAHDSAATTPYSKESVVDWQADDSGAFVQFQEYTDTGTHADGELANRKNTIRGHFKSTVSAKVGQARGWRNKFLTGHEGGGYFSLHTTAAKEIDYDLTGDVKVETFKAVAQAATRSGRVNGKSLPPKPYATSSASTTVSPDFSKPVQEHTFTGSSISIEAPSNLTDAESMILWLINGGAGSAVPTVNTAYIHAPKYTPYLANAGAVTQTTNKLNAVTSNTVRTLLTLSSAVVPANKTGWSRPADAPVAAAQGAGSGKFTAVAANGKVIDVTTAAGNLAAAGIATFVLTNTSIAVGDTVLVEHVSGGTALAYKAWGYVTAANTASIFIQNDTGGALNEQPVLRVTVIKADGAAAQSSFAFTFNNSQAEYGDEVIINHVSGGTHGAYAFSGRVASTGIIQIAGRNLTGSDLSEAPVLLVELLKGGLPRLAPGERLCVELVRVGTGNQLIVKNPIVSGA